MVYTSLSSKAGIYPYQLNNIAPPHGNPMNTYGTMETSCTKTGVVVHENDRRLGKTESSHGRAMNQANTQF